MFVDTHFLATIALVAHMAVSATGLATALLVLAPILAVLHIAGISEALGHVIKFNKLLGLDFQFEPGERVRIRSNAPSIFRPGATGCVVSVRSVQVTNLATRHPAKRTICYMIQFEDGVNPGYSRAVP